MSTHDIARQRLNNLGIAHPRGWTPAEVVASLGAIQAQDFIGARWAVGLRLPGGTEADIERALMDGSIVRTWPMRGTLHFVAATDVRWMLRLLTPRVISGSASR
ncbi:MAG TPA: crosslink repair DNA glycosylase YcaQ family protein, partial [Thermomicrobiaceae bacterium]|nr:crosslink repair DNA glycosylase YcaQ family protein [Thermomicrobiaceae bacterium]